MVANPLIYGSKSSLMPYEQHCYRNKKRKLQPRLLPDCTATMKTKELRKKGRNRNTWQGGFLINENFLQANMIKHHYYPIFSL